MSALWLCLAVAPPRCCANSKAASAVALSNSRREIAVLSCIAPLTIWLSASSSHSAMARDRSSRRDVPIEQFNTSDEGVKYIDLTQGNGPAAERGASVLVHFDCIYRGVDAVSSRESKLLAGNRIIAQPYELVVGSTPGKERKRDFAENANGLYSAQAAPKPPAALYKAVEGMRVGGKRRVIVTPDIGYGGKRMNEIPPDATFQLDIELLEVRK